MLYIITRELLLDRSMNRWMIYIYIYASSTDLCRFPGWNFIERQKCWATGATGATGRAIWRLPCNGAHQTILGSKNVWWCLVMYLCGGPKWPVSLWDLQIYMFYIIYVYMYTYIYLYIYIYIYIYIYTYIYIYIMYYIRNNRGVIHEELRIKARGMIMRSQEQPWPRTIGWLRAAMVHMCQRDYFWWTRQHQDGDRVKNGPSSIYIYIYIYICVCVCSYIIDFIPMSTVQELQSIGPTALEGDAILMLWPICPS